MQGHNLRLKVSEGREEASVGGQREELGFSAEMSLGTHCSQIRQELLMAKAAQRANRLSTRHQRA